MVIEIYVTRRREREKAINNNTESERRTTTRKELKREGEKEIESERD